MNIALALASLLTLVTWAIHTFVGGPEIARPLLRSELETVPKLTNYYCWHLVTLTMLGLAAALGLAAFLPDWRNAAILSTLLTTTYALWSLWLMLSRHRRIQELPQWVLFGTIAAVAAAGLWS